MENGPSHDGERLYRRGTGADTGKIGKKLY